MPSLLILTNQLHSMLIQTIPDPNLLATHIHIRHLHSHQPGQHVQTHFLPVRILLNRQLGSLSVPLQVIYGGYQSGVG
jgi:hypothetical protein